MIDTTTPLPNDQGFEKSVLSTLLDNPGKLDEARSLSADHFYKPAHKSIFEIIVEIGAGKTEIDLTNLIHIVQSRGLTEHIGGLGELASIHGYAPTDGYFLDHVAKLNGLFSRRKAVQAGFELARAANDLTDPLGYLHAASFPITEIHDIAAATKPSRDTKQMLSEFVQSFQDLASGKKTPMGMKTSIPCYNTTLGGIHGKRITVISGFPTSGKSLLASQFCIDLATSGHPSAFVSLELPSEGVIQRAVVQLSGLNHDVVCKPVEWARSQGRDQLSRIELQKVQAAIAKLSESPFFVEDPTGATISQIIAIIRRLHRKHGIKAVAVDYLQLIRGDKRGKGETKEQEIAEISHAFQAIAKELDIHIFLLSQQNKEGGTKHAEATTEDADYLVSIIQDRTADAECFPHIGLGIRKDRHNGKTGSMMPIVLNKERLIFYEVDHRHEPDEPQQQPRRTQYQRR